jgi:hypothetical protein
VETAKWESWSQLGNMSSMEAMRLYVKLVEDEQVSSSSLALENIRQFSCLTIFMHGHWSPLHGQWHVHDHYTVPFDIFRCTMGCKTMQAQKQCPV